MSNTLDGQAHRECKRTLNGLNCADMSLKVIPIIKNYSKLFKQVVIAEVAGVCTAASDEH